MLKYSELNVIKIKLIKLWDPGKAVPRGKIIVLEACIRKGEQSKISNPTFQFSKIEKEKQCKLKASRREIIKVTMKSMKLKRKPVKKINKNVSWFSSK